MVNITQEAILKVERNKTDVPKNFAEVMRKIPHLRILAEGDDYYWGAYDMQENKKEESLDKAIMEVSMMAYMEGGF